MSRMSMMFSSDEENVDSPVAQEYMDDDETQYTEGDSMMSAQEAQERQEAQEIIRAKQVSLMPDTSPEHFEEVDDDDNILMNATSLAKKKRDLLLEESQDYLPGHSHEQFGDRQEDSNNFDDTQEDSNPMSSQGGSQRNQRQQQRQITQREHIEVLKDA